jgi:hypothetical protein
VTHSRWQSLTQFVRLWFVLAFSFVLVKLACDLLTAGLIDVRRTALWQLSVVPLAQAAAYWLITRRARARSPAGAPVVEAPRRTA